MNNSEYKKVVTFRDWHTVDLLDGEPLNNDEKLEIIWPDKTISKQKVIVRESEETVSDMGNPFVCRHRHAYVIISAKGIKTDVRLANTDCKCKRIK